MTTMKLIISQSNRQPCTTKLVIGPFEFPSQIKLSDYKLSNWKLSNYKLSNYSFLDKLVQNTDVFGPVKFKEIVIFIINTIMFCVLLCFLGLQFWIEPWRATDPQNKMDKATNL